MINQKRNIWSVPVFVVLMALLCTMLWGSASPSIKKGYEVFAIQNEDIATKIIFAGVRFALAGIAVLIFYSIKEKKIPTVKRNEILPLTGVSLLQTTMQYIFFYVGLTYTTGTKGALFSSLNGFFAVLLAPLVYKNDKFTGSKIIGCIMALIGLILISLDSSIAELSGFKLVGEGFITLGSLCNAICFFITRRLSKTINTTLITGYQLLIGALVLVAIGIAFGGNLQFTSVDCYVIMAYLAMLSAVAYTVWNMLITNNIISKVSIYQLFIPIFGAVISGILLHESIFTWQNISALIFVASGVYLVNTVRFDKLKEE